MSTVSVFLNKRVKSSDGKNGLYLRIIRNRKDKTEISLKVKVFPSEWDERRKVVKAKNRNAKSINLLLEREQYAYKQILLKKELAAKPFTLKEVVLERKNPNSKPSVSKITFLEYFKSYIDDNPDNLKYNTIQGYVACYNAVNLFTSGLDFEQLTPQWVSKFEKHLIRKGKAINTIWGRMKALKKLSKKAQEEGLLNDNPFKFYKSKTESGEREFLTRSELSAFEAIETSTKLQTLIKDVFLFSCYTGLRFSDIVTLQREDLIVQKNKENGTNYYLSFRMDKTREMLQIKLNSKAKRIVKSYLVNNALLVFPILADQVYAQNDQKILKKAISSKNAYYNRVIKGLCSKAEINKSISMHCGRHTFATISLDLDVPIQVVSKLLGHKNLRETMIYSKILDKQKDAAIDKWETLK